MELLLAMGLSLLLAFSLDFLTSGDRLTFLLSLQKPQTGREGVRRDHGRYARRAESVQASSPASAPPGPRGAGRPSAVAGIRLRQRGLAAPICDGRSVRSSL